MEFVNQEFYHKQKIVEQYIDSKGKLSIITRDKATGKYVLWQEDKKIATNKSPLELREKIKKINQ